MIATSEDGWIFIRDETMPTDYVTSDIKPGMVVVIDSSVGWSGYTTAEKAAEIVAKAVQEIEKEFLQAHMEELEHEATDWPTAREPNAGIGSRKSPVAKARGPPACPGRVHIFIPCWQGKGCRSNAGASKA